MIQSFHQIDEMIGAVTSWREASLRVALVPTMGGLHDGHLSLVEAALAHHDKVVVSIYVNPTQFAAHEDLDAYPRTMAEDLAALSAYGERVCVFVPQSLYQTGHATMITPKGAALPLEGVHRPHFFQGVATVVFRLFQAVPAHCAFFGEKDFQQLAVIRQMVHDFTLPIRIESVPTKRALDGLALSSRNGYLSAEERLLAPMLYQEMRRCALAVSEGQDPDEACGESQARLQEAGFGQSDYFAFHEAQSLLPASSPCGQSRLMAAIWLGHTRLIDNDSLSNLCAAQ